MQATALHWGKEPCVLGTGHGECSDRDCWNLRNALTSKTFLCSPVAMRPKSGRARSTTRGKAGSAEIVRLEEDMLAVLVQGKMNIQQDVDGERKGEES